MTSRRNDRSPLLRSPMTSEALERLAVRYVARYATTSAKLAAYLGRKCRERPTTEDTGPDIATIVAQMVALGYVDDTAYAELKTASLGRRGYGARRIGAALHDAGIQQDTAHNAIAAQSIDPQTAINTYLQRRRLGPFSAYPASPELRQKVIAALLRAGHRYDDAVTALAPWHNNAIEC